MNTLRKQILVGLAALSMGAAALGVQAQTAPAEGRHGHAATQEQRQAKRADFMAERQAKLHDALKLTSAQEPAWNSFINAVKPQPQADHQDRAAWASLSAPARMEKMIALSKERTARMEQHLQALNTFYAVLTPEQKKVFDQHAMRGMGQHFGHGGHGGEHGGQGGHHGQAADQQGAQQG
jgi:Spy/CpxP family protein refolding chaperone